MSSKSAAKKPATPARMVRNGKRAPAATSARLAKPSARPEPKKSSAKAAPKPIVKPSAKAAPAKPIAARPAPAKPAPTKPVGKFVMPALKNPALKGSTPKVSVPTKSVLPAHAALKPGAMPGINPTSRSPFTVSTAVAHPKKPPPPPGSLLAVQAPPKPAPLPPRPPAPRPLPPKLPQRQATRSFYWSELRVGDDLPTLVKAPIDRLQIARYAGAANDFNRLQLDEPFAHSLGFRGTFAPGALAMGFVGQLLTNWLKRGHVRKLSARFIKIIWPGDQLTCHGRISELRKERGACYADLELYAENQKGELVLRGHATCELYETPGSAPSPVGAPFSSAAVQRPVLPGTRPILPKK
jgi:acyl dehydratase